MVRPVLLLATWLALAGCVAKPQAIDPRVPLRLEPPTRRVEAEGRHTLEIAVRDYIPGSGKGPAVRLVGVIHVGDRAYYEAVQVRLDAADLVLFEGVSASPDDFKKAPAQRRKDHLYTKVADALGLVTQFEGIDYRREHFVNADLSVAAMEATLDREIAGGGAGADAARAAKGQMDTLGRMLQGGGGGLTGMAVNLLIGMVERSPRMRATVLLGLVGMDPMDGKGGFSRTGGAGGERLGRLILDDRNEAAMAALAPELRRGNPADRTVAVFYGAAHLPGLEDALIRRHGYVPSTTEWLPALSVDPAAAGMTPTEVEQALKAARRGRR
jgi:hypothetical protein